jgi:hypothetical protein
MRLKILCLTCLFALVCVAPDLFAFSVVDQNPNIDRYQNFTYRPMRIVFDDSIDTGTVSNTTVFIHPEGDASAELSLSFGFESGTLTNDTLVVTPLDNSGRWPFAKRLTLNITAGLESSGSASFDGTYPWGQVFVANIPNDMDVLAAWDQTDPLNFVDAFVNANVLLGYNPVDPENTDPSKPETIPGMGATEAWKVTAGRPDVLIAVVDDGSERYEYAELETNYFLNRGELPAPTDGGTACTPNPWDCNGDGKFNVRDYDDDPAFSGLGTVTINDLFDRFEDGLDDDGNGYPDDICGWDFLRNTNKALGVMEFPEGGHGEDRARDAAGVADNGIGEKPGYCPRCSILPVRVSDSVMAEMNLQGAGVKYAYEMGSAVAVFASETLSYSGEINKMFTEFSEGGMMLVGVASDEMSYHHAYSGSCDEVLSVKAIFPLPPIDFLGFFPMELLAFTETYCTMWGENLHLAASSGACSSEAAGNVAGLAGLIISRAWDLGLTLSANEVKQILTMSADDIYRRCLTWTGGSCQPGWDAHFGYGRPNAVSALEVLGDPDKGIDPAIPPEVRFRTPAWFTIFDPVNNPSVEVSAYMNARGTNFNWKLQVAAGKEPLDNQFATVATGQSSAEIDEAIGQVDISGLLPASTYENPPQESFDFTVTLRLQASYDHPTRGTINGEDRRTVAVHRDQYAESGLLDGFPINLEASGEGAIVAYDLDGDVDGRLELITATADAWLSVYKQDDDSGEYVPLSGFPVDLNAISGFDLPGDPINAPVASPAIADLYRDGIPYIVVTTVGGSVIAVHRDGNDHPGGPLVQGFPVFSDEPDNSSTEGYAHGRGFYSEPVVTNLNDDPYLEIVAAGFDGKVYAWSPVDADSDGFADLLPGFPVLAKSEAGNVEPDKICIGDLDAFPPLILGTPVVGVFDPDSADPDVANYPSIFIGTSEVCGSPIKNTRVYGIYHDGYANVSGSAFLPGFPLKPTGPLSDLLPLPPVTLGITSTPAMARYDGKTWLGIGSAIWLPQLFEWDGNKITLHTLPSSGFNALAHGSFGRLAGDDRVHYVLPISSAIDSIDGWISLLRPMLEAWSLDDVENRAFSMEMEDSNWYLGASIADISGDGTAEMLAGSGGFFVHGVDLEGNKPAGWPKFTNGWSVSSPTVGDVDGDGYLEVFNFVREGYLFGWRSKGEACTENGGAPDWWTDHRDERHTGMLDTDTQPPLVAVNVEVEREGSDYTISFEAPGDDWRCGTAQSYDIRYADSAADLMEPDGFASAQSLGSPEPVSGGSNVTIEAKLSETGLWFAIRSVDDAGNLSLISSPAQASDDGDDDDDSDDDDSSDDDDAGSGDDDDDTSGCCG